MKDRIKAANSHYLRVVVAMLLFMIVTSCDKEPIEPIGTTGSFTDPRDGKTYPTVTLGTQTWMSANLDYAYEPGAGSWYYNNDTAYKAYGRLYTWEAARRACPQGWHLPSDGEWKALEIFLGMDASEADSLDWRDSGAIGIKIKAVAGWNDGGTGVNQAQFGALPAGFRETDGLFYFEGDLANFWTATYTGETHAYGRALIYFSAGVYRWQYDRRSGFSVRCVAD